MSADNIARAIHEVEAALSWVPPVSPVESDIRHRAVLSSLLAAVRELATTIHQLPEEPADRRSIAHQATRLIGEKIPTGREFHRPERPDPLSAWTDSAVDAERRRIWALIEKHPDRRAFAQAAGIWLELTAIKHVVFEGDEP